MNPNFRVFLRNPVQDRGFSGGPVVKNSPAKSGATEDNSLILGLGRSPGEGKWQHAPVFLPGKSHGQRSLAGIVDGVEKSQTQMSTHIYSKKNRYISVI